VPLAACELDLSFVTTHRTQPWSGTGRRVPGRGLAGELDGLLPDGPVIWMINKAAYGPEAGPA
jgi:hypothetical protein